MGFGDSSYIQSHSPQLFGSAEFYPFAPAPCSCLGCCVPTTLQARTFIHVYDNRFTANMPCAPYGCCTTDEKCMVDRTSMTFYDRQPTRTGMFCFVIPMTCCGPPVIFVQKPYICCCIDVSEYFGTTIMASPTSVCNLKKYLVCGGPCYKCCAAPLFPGIKNGEKFLADWDKALRGYGKMSGISDSELAVFAVVKDSELDHQAATKVQVAPNQANMGRE
mmetsp:Transcript_68404/g.149369  ORF Transcript_68404/g.149369 Transcript_68404/m.149369 type:complete len:219 (-) Transcript_68404:406-1062(-)